jgi:hypothetical protein
MPQLSQETTNQMTKGIATSVNKSIKSVRNTEQKVVLTKTSNQIMANNKAKLTQKQGSSLYT